MYKRQVPGYATIVVGMMFFSGIQLLSIGVLAEYVGRIYEEVKQRPPYLISERAGGGLARSVKAAAGAAGSEVLTPSALRKGQG